MPDDNDIVYQTYGLDIVSIIRAIYEKLLGGDFEALLDQLEGWWNIYSVIAIILSIVFFLIFVYARIRYGQLEEVEMAQLKNQEIAWQHAYAGGAVKNDRWVDIQKHVAEDNPNDWRLAIIEADIMLEDTLNNAGYMGISVGDKLKSASFDTLSDAWEAHKVRNEIAHAGSDFVLTKRVAQETITRFERVFREFGVV